jgi:uncharacterized delta-60 repeat protein
MYNVLRSVVLFTLFIAGAGYAQNGGLDITFNGTGKVTTAWAPDADGANCSALQSDGKIVVAGYAFNGTNNVFAIGRYNINGTIDNTLNGSGKVLLAIGSGYDEARGVAVQSDGKIVIAGYSWNGSNNDITVVRLNSNGSLDITFGGDGIVTTDIDGRSDEAHGMAIQSDGKILVVGYTDNGSNNDISVVRYNTDGTADNTFSNDGIVTTAIGSSHDEAKCIALQSDGKIVVSGYSHNGINGDIAVARYSNTGTLDNTFGSNGIVVTDINSKYQESHSLAIQTDGKIVVAGYTDTESNGSDALLLRYSDSGILDNTFDGDGKVLTTISANDDLIRSIDIQSDGKIVATGYTWIGSDQVIAVHRYKNDGSLDNTFGTNGIVTTSVNQAGSDANNVIIQSDGKIVVVGSTTDGGNYDLAIVRYIGNAGTGDLDITLNGTGNVLTSIGSQSSGIRSVALQTDGKIVAAGYASNGTNNDIAVVRYTDTGIPDNAFNTTGKVLTAVGGASDEGYGVAVQPDGKIVVAGTAWNGSNNDIAVLRYNSNGSLDNSFGGDGIVTTDILSNDNVAYGVAIQPDGKIVVVGYANNGSNNDFAAVRYHSDGTLDGSFGGDGIVTTAVGISNDEGSCVTLQSDGKIVAAGFSNNGVDNDAVIVRYNIDGTLDASFDSDGRVILDIAGDGDELYGITMQSDGKILVTGWTSNGSNNDIVVLRYSSAGVLDNSFDTDGKVITSLSSYDDVGQSIAVQSDGKIIVTGYSSNDTDQEIAVLRYLSTGALDNTFGTNGAIITGAQLGQQDYAAALVIQPDSTIVVAGTGSNGSIDNFSLFRFLGDAGPLAVLSYSGSVFSESASSDGTINNLAPVIILLSGDTFTGSNTDNFVTGGKIVVNNLPSGLAAVITRTSSTTLEVTLTGSATSHALSNSVSNLTFTFQNTAFTGGNASGVTNYLKNDLEVSFTDPQPGNALRFDGGDDYVQVPYSANLNPAQFTYEVWARVDGGSGSYRTPLSSRDYDGFTTVSGVHFYAASNDKWEGWIGKGGSGWSIITGADVVEGEWTHLAETYDGTTQRFYVNGVLQGSAVVPFTQNTLKPVRFGSTSDALNFYFVGDIDEARIWNIALDSIAIQQRMHLTVAPSSTNLVGYWQFNHTSGGTVQESHGYTGTLNNFDHNGTSGWVSSTVAAGPGTSATSSAFTSGTATMGDVSLTTTEAFDNAVNLTATVLSAIPNTVPGGYSSVIGDKYYVVNAFGVPGTFTANLTINFGASALDSRVNTNPDGVRLYKRSSISDGSWTLVGGAVSANSATGNVTWNGITSFSQFAAVYEESALPVELVSFTASAQKNGIELQWKTATEVNNHGFEIERKLVSSSMLQVSSVQSSNLKPACPPGRETSNDQWTRIAFVEGNGNSNVSHEYSYTDRTLSAGKYSYRLKQIDRDGKFSYSPKWR